MVTFEYVGYFNGAEMVQVLNGIAAIVGSENGFGGLVKAIAIGGFITVMMTALIKLDIKEAAHYVLALAFVNTLMFAPLGRVVVIDKYAATTTASATVVDNVPLGVAFAVGELNHIGVYMTDLYESVFSEVDAPKFTTTGMMFGARLYEKLGTLEISDVNLRRNMGSFVTSCVNPELVDYPDKVEPLRKSGKLVEDLLQNGMGILNPARIVSQTYSQIPLDCVTAGAGLAANFAPAATDNVSNTILDKIGASLNLVSPRDVGAGNAALRSIVAQKMETGASYIMSQSLTAKDQIDQAVMANLFTSAQQNAGALSGDTATAISSVLAKRQVEQQYKTMRVIAEEALPRLRSMVEYVCVAIFPAVLLIMVAAGAKALLVLRVYLGILLSINLWPPLYAVVNHLMTLSSTKYKMAAIIQNEGVLSLNNIQAIQAAADSDLAMAGLLTLSIPAIALALVKGGDAALTGAIGGITAPATSAAGSVAANTSSGNFNYGNYGAGNFSAANTQLGQSRRDPNVAGGFSSINSGTGVLKTFGDGQGGTAGATFDQSGVQSNLPFGLSGAAQTAASNALSAQKSQAFSQKQSAQNAINSGVSAELERSGSVRNQNGTSANLSSDAKQDLSRKIGETLSSGYSRTVQAAREAGFTNQEIDSASVSAGGNGAVLAANLQSIDSGTKSRSDKLSRSMQNDESFKRSKDLASSTGTGASFSVGSDNGTQRVNVSGFSVSSNTGASSSFAKANEKLNSLSSAETANRVNGITANTKALVDAFDGARGAQALGGGVSANSPQAQNAGALIRASETPSQTAQAFNGFVTGLVNDTVASQLAQTNAGISGGGSTLGNQVGAAGVSDVGQPQNLAATPTGSGVTPQAAQGALGSGAGGAVAAFGGVSTDPNSLSTRNPTTGAPVTAAGVTSAARSANEASAVITPIRKPDFGPVNEAGANAAIDSGLENKVQNALPSGAPRDQAAVIRDGAAAAAVATVLTSPSAAAAAVGGGISSLARGNAPGLQELAEENVNGVNRVLGPPITPAQDARAQRPSQ